MRSTDKMAEQPNDPRPELVKDMTEAQHRLIAHDAIRRIAESLSGQGIAVETIIAALFGVAAGELVWREGANTTAATLRDYADGIERRGPVTLHDMKEAGNA